MKILVIGDSASGKSEFANRLGSKLSIPVIHLDEVMESVGREDTETIQKIIHDEIKKEKWILDGNAFTKDKEERIHAADMIFVFDLHPLESLVGHIGRYLKLKLGIQKKRIGSTTETLDLPYFVPYIFWKFPKRKREAVNLARFLGKDIVVFKDRNSASRYISHTGV